MDRPKLISSEGTEIIINTDKFTIGRSISNSYILEIISISRVHCILEKQAIGWTITDKSSNGMLVNARKLQKDIPEVLKHNDMVFLSNEVAFTFKLPSEDFTDMGIDDESIAQIADNSETRRSGDSREVNRRRTRQYNQEIISLENSVIEVLQPSSSTKESSKVVVNSLTDSISSVKSPSKDALSSSKLDFFVNELTCSICMELFINASTLNCRHTYCSHCIESWRKYHKVCPMCRTKITKEVSSIVIDNVVNKIVEGMSKGDVKRRQQIIAERVKEPKKSKSGRRKTRGRRGEERRGDESPIEISSEDEDIVV